MSHPWLAPTPALVADVVAATAKDGVRDLRQSGLVKVRIGVTTLEEVIAVTNE